jgi:hypothetical protein
MIYAQININEVTKEADIIFHSEDYEEKENINYRWNEYEYNAICWDSYDEPIKCHSNALDFLAKEGFTPVSETFFYKV